MDPTTVRRAILAHLDRNPWNPEGYEAPLSVTRPGIYLALPVGKVRINTVLRELEKEGLAFWAKKHVRQSNSRFRFEAYFITEEGRKLLERSQSRAS